MIMLWVVYSLSSTYDIRNNVIVKQGKHDFTTNIIGKGINNI